MTPRMMGTDRDRCNTLIPPFDTRVIPSSDLPTDNVRHFFDHRFEMHGNKRLKVGGVNEADKGKVVSWIVTVDKSQVQRLQVDRHSGEVKRVE